MSDIDTPPDQVRTPIGFEDREGFREEASRVGRKAAEIGRDAERAIASVPPLGWLLGGLGAGIVGAGLYAAFAADGRGRPVRRRSGTAGRSTRSPAKRRQSRSTPARSE